MMRKRFLFGRDAKEQIYKGIDLMYNCVSATYGAYGRNVLIDRMKQVVDLTKDGVSVADEVDPVDDVERMGCQLARVASQNTNEEAGDGPQPLYANVLTPVGFVKMGDLNVGDEICGTNKTIQRVVGVYPKGEKEIYEVKLTDGRVVECCEDHLWSVTTNYGADKIMTVREIIDSGNLEKTSNDGYRLTYYYLPRTTVDFKEGNLEVDPYFLGTLIGDGSLSGSSRIELSIGKNKEHIIDKLVLPDGVEYKAVYCDDKNYYRVSFDGNTILRSKLKTLGLFGTRSKTKFIPKSYLYSSLQTRKALLQGLLDTDGYINNRGLFEFSTVSDQLAFDFQELCRGLGISLNHWVNTNRGEGAYSNTLVHRISQLQGYKYGYAIDSIEKTGKFTEMQCIKVSNPDNLYITDDYVVTHNTTAAIVLARTMCKEALEMPKKSRVISVKNGIQKAIDACTERIKKEAVPISTEEEFKKVTTVSSQDQETGSIVAKAFMEAGENGSLEIERGDEPGIVVEKTTGLSFDKGYVIPHCINQKNARAVQEDIPVLVTDAEIKSQHQIVPLLQSIPDELKLTKILIIAEEFKGDTIGMIAKTNMAGSFHIIPVRAPGYGRNKIETLKDICAATGATFVSEESQGLLLEKATISQLGRARRVTVERESTVITSETEGAFGEKVKKDVFDRIEMITTQLEEEKDVIKIQDLETRLATLTDGITVLNVGGQTEQERRELHHRVEDSVRAAKSARDEGVVPGGGVMLLRCIEEVDKLKGNKDEQFGFHIVRSALFSPMRRLLEVANVDDVDTVIAHIRDKGGNYGYDFQKETLVDMMEADIHDAAKVIRSSLQNAASIAKNFLTLDCVIISVEDDPWKKIAEQLKS